MTRTYCVFFFVCFVFLVFFFLIHWTLDSSIHPLPIHLNYLFKAHHDITAVIKNLWLFLDNYVIRYKSLTLAFKILYQVPMYLPRFISFLIFFFFFTSEVICILVLSDYSLLPFHLEKNIMFLPCAFIYIYLFYDCIMISCDVLEGRDYFFFNLQINYFISKLTASKKNYFGLSKR